MLEILSTFLMLICEMIVSSYGIHVTAYKEKKIRRKLLTTCATMISCILIAVILLP